jgi:hypothetical protein
MELFTPGVGPKIHARGGSRAMIEQNNEVVEVMRRLIDPGTVIYTTEAAGLQTGQLDASDRVGGDASALTQLTHVSHIGSRDWVRNVMQQGLACLADRTGGPVYDNGTT